MTATGQEAWGHVVTLPAEIPTRQQRRSASQLTSYSACGEAYRLERVARAPRRPAAWFFQGSAVHEAIEAWENSRRKLSPDEVEDIFVISYREAANEAIEEHNGSLDPFMTGGFKKPETDLTDRERTGIFQVHDYMRIALQEEDEWAVVRSELPFEMDIGGVTVIGYIDQVVMNLKTGKVYPRDIKSGASLPTTPVQLAIYTLALIHEAKASEGAVKEGLVTQDKALPWLPGDVLTDYAEWFHAGKPESASGKTKAKEGSLVPEDLSLWGRDRIAGWLTEMDRSEKLGIYLPNPTSGCERVCGVAMYCSVMGKHEPSMKKYAPGVVADAT